MNWIEIKSRCIAFQRFCKYRFISKSSLLQKAKLQNKLLVQIQIDMIRTQELTEILYTINQYKH